MGKHYLCSLFELQTTAVSGASDCIDSVELIVIEHLPPSAFPSKLYPVTPSYKTVQGSEAYPSFDPVGQTVDPAIITPCSSQSLLSLMIATTDMTTQ
ncbi:MAG: hypothetical protein PHZ02_02430 [Desulfocapsaceae bacterium]|nr:hypothetical protein [Desulfocapsaceae bacterium]